jgi:hypothetical protein
MDVAGKQMGCVCVSQIVEPEMSEQSPVVRIVRAQCCEM